MVRFPARGPSRRHVLWAVGALVVVVSLLWWMTPGGRDRPTGTATLATGVPSGVYARYGTLLKERLPRDLPEVELGLRPSQGSVDNIEQVVAGKVDFTIAQADAVAAYLTSEARMPPGCGPAPGCTTTTCSSSSAPTPMSSRRPTCEG